MKKNVLIALAISAMLLASCKKEDPEEITTTVPEVETNEPQSPIPLKVGNKWVYNVYAVKYDISGNVVSEQLEESDTFKVVRKEIVDNQEYFVVNGCLSCGTPKFLQTDEQYLRNENGRLVEQKFKTNYSINTSTEPLDSFLVDSLLKIIYFVQSYDSTVVVPAGNFDNVIETKGESYYYDNPKSQYVRNKETDRQSLYSPQIGLLSDKVFFANKIAGYRRELVSYKLN